MDGLALEDSLCDAAAEREPDAHRLADSERAADLLTEGHAELE